jgi:ABC-type glycerol-3-phosphate transport system permease component
MADLLNLIMLVCAAVGSMAFGVLTAYAIFRIGFMLMRPRRPLAAVKVRPELAAD